MSGSSACGAGDRKVEQRLESSRVRRPRRGVARAGAIALTVAALGVFATGARAQYQGDASATAPASGQVAAQPGGMPPAPPPNYRAAPGGYGSQFDDLRNGSGSQSDFPAAQMSATVDAYARATAARAAYDRAYSALNMAVDGMRHDFEQSADYRNADLDVRRAYVDLLAARRDAMSKVVDDPKYQAAVSLRDEMTRQIATSRRADAKIERLVAMAMVKLGYASTATAMEVVATADDPRVHDAQMRLISAGAHQSELWHNFEDRVRTDPGMLALRRNLEDARTNNLIAAAVLQGSIDVSDEALNYAYYKHRYDYYYAANAASYYGGYSGYGYPYVAVNGR